MTTRRALLMVDAAGVGAMALLTAFGFFMGVKPAAEARAADAARRDELAATWAGIAQADRSLAAARAGLARARDAADHAIRFATPAALNQRLGELSSACEPSGARIAEIVPAPPTPAGRFRRIVIRVAGDATYPQAAALLADLHREFPDTEVTGFTLGGQPENPGSPGRLSLELAWYVLPAPARADSAGAPTAPARERP